MERRTIVATAVSVALVTVSGAAVAAAQSGAFRVEQEAVGTSPEDLPAPVEVRTVYVDVTEPPTPTAPKEATADRPTVGFVDTDQAWDDDPDSFDSYDDEHSDD